MAKVTNPLFSGDASGDFGKQMIFKRGGIVTKYFSPRNPNTIAQANHRQAFKEYYMAALTQAQADLLYAMIAHQHSAADVTLGVLNSARLGSGVADANKYLRGDSTWAAYKPPITLADHYGSVGNVTTGEDDLYSYTIPAGRLAADGDKITAKYSGYFVGHATATRRVKLYVGGQMFYDTSALAETSTGQWVCEVTIVRTSSTTARALGQFQRRTLPVSPQLYSLTGLNWAVSNVLKITGESAGTGGGVSSDVVAQIGIVNFQYAV